MKFNSVLLFARPNDPSLSSVLFELIEVLCAFNLKVYLDVEAAKLALNNPLISKLEILPIDKASSIVDLIITIGGDGSLLRAARYAIANNKPIIGINKGKLGFLTDIDPKSITDSMAEIFNKRNFSIEKRFLLSIKLINQKNEVVYEDFAINDVVINRGTTTHMMKFAAFLEDELVCMQNVDGLILATSTGSTAYSLSGGGPILHPNLEAFVMVPMFPHSLNARPIVFSSENSMTIKIMSNVYSQSIPNFSCDGMQSVDFHLDYKLLVQKDAKNCLSLLHLKNYSFLKNLREKLNWGMI